MPRRTGLETTRARSSWAGSKSLWRQTTSRPCFLPRRKLGTLLQDLRSAQQSARTVAPGAVNQLAAHVGRYFLEDRGQPNILNLKFCNSNFEPKPDHVLGPSLGSRGQNRPRSLVAAGRFPEGNLKICLRRRRDGRQLPSPRGAVGVEFARVQDDQVQEIHV